MKSNQIWNPWLLGLVAAIGIGMAALQASAGVVLHIGVGVPGPAPAVYHYEYFPDAQVYYVPDTRVYWWLADGAWVSGPHVPEGIDLGTRVQLDVDAPDPWHHHDVVVKQYPGHGRDHDHDKDRH